MKDDRHVILFLAAAPRNSNVLQLTEECADIQRELRMARNRDRFRFEARWAVSIDEMMRNLTELDPAVIHFSGHGCGAVGLVLHDDRNDSQLISTRGLAMMVRAAAPGARLVVLNACYSVAQAEELTRSVDCVVSMGGPIADDAARAFAVRFYGALGNGRSIGNAIEHGIAALAARQMSDEVIPRCLTRGGIDADGISLL